MMDNNNVTIACPIVYGSIAFYLGKKAEEFHTHRWTLFVRGPHDEDLSIFVEKVAFTLHPSFEVQVRVVTQPPFEITETGWGEFEVGIRLYFKDPEEQPVDIFHQLRLYPPIPQQQLNVKKPVVAENYDEIIFYAPSSDFYSKLMMYGQSNLSQESNSSGDLVTHNNPSNDHDSMEVVETANPDSNIKHSSGRKPTAFPEYYTAFDDNVDCELLLSIKEHLDREIVEARNRHVNLEAEYVDAMNRKQQEMLASVTTTTTTATNPTTTTSSTAPSTSQSPNNPSTETGLSTSLSFSGATNNVSGTNNPNNSNSNNNNLSGHATASMSQTPVPVVLNNY